MKRWLKIVLIVVLILLVVVAAGAYKILGPRAFLGPRARPLTARTFERTPARLARGKYLMEGVLPCVHCHSPHDWSQRDAAIPAGKEFSGVVINEVGPPGRIVAPNLTPDMETGTGSWPEKTEISFPLKYIMRNFPEPLTAPVPERTFATPEQRGKYLTQLIGCADCHTPVDSHQNPIPGMKFGGGQVFEGPWGTVASANLTPDPSGIPYFDQALFIRTIRTGYVGSRPLKPIMPWPVFRNMTDDDLSAIFAYLKTLKPVHHRVDNSMTPTLCPIDGGMHGAGDQNRKQ